MIDDLTATLQRVGSAVYQQAGGPAEGGPSADAPDANPDDTVEGEFREV